MIAFITYFTLAVCANTAWIDPDTPIERTVVHSYHNPKEEYSLVFSDEFEVENRKFGDGEDQRWTALSKNDYTNNALNYYDASAVTTTAGKLNITTKLEEKIFNFENASAAGKKGSIKKLFKSGMLQGWNKFCFTGGIVEISAKLPGQVSVGGLWPALWMMGNLARATYVGSSENIWPWSSNICDRTNQPGQAISACNRVEHFDLHAKQGRGAPEIDILEAMPGPPVQLRNIPVDRPYSSTSYQVAPAIKHRPRNGDPPEKGYWYEQGLKYGKNVTQNILFYGDLIERKDGNRVMSYQADAISANTGLKQKQFDHYHTYRMEWDPPSPATSEEMDENAANGSHVVSSGSMRWYVDDKFIFSISDGALDKTGGSVPQEPMYLIMNTAVSKTWGFPWTDGCGGGPACYDCSWECACWMPVGFCKQLDHSNFLIDHVRVYQNKKNVDHTVGCSTKRFPTKKFIKSREPLYKDAKDAVPLKPVKYGGAACSKHEDCGPDAHGYCEGVLPAPIVIADVKASHHTCVCYAAFAGPHCLTYAGFDPIDPNALDEIDLSAPVLFIPSFLLILVSTFAVGFGGSVWYFYYLRTIERKNRWKTP